MDKLIRFNKSEKLQFIVISILILLCLSIGLYIKDLGILMPILVIAISCLIAVQICFIKQPKSAVWLMLFYSFTFNILSREIGGGVPYGTLQEGIMLLGWLTLIFTANRYEWNDLNNDISILLLIWFGISVLEVGNPAGASVQGWLQEIRAAAFYPVLLVPMAFLLMKTNKDLNRFFYFILSLSLYATLNGIKQLYIGPSAGEQFFLDNGGALTHILWGQLRVFSFYSDAGQFGASQAHIGLIALILAFGPFKIWKRIVLLIAAGLMIYGMLISGTRGALFALIVGAFVAIVLSKQFKVIIIGSIIGCSFLFFLKYTTIGNDNYQIMRLRSAVDPKEASMNLRFENQQKIRNYLQHIPFGGGLGVIGVWGEAFNKDKYLSTIQPDSYWVKVWAMYGIVGFTIWLGIMMYILGKCCGIVWNIKDKGLRIKAMALTSGFAGILICSYANEVINTAPSSYVVYLSWVFVAICPKLEDEILRKKQSLNLK